MACLNQRLTDYGSPHRASHPLAADGREVSGAVARPWTQVPDRREDRTRRAANKRATPGRLRAIPCSVAQIP